MNIRKIKILIIFLAIFLVFGAYAYFSYPNYSPTGGIVGTGVNNFSNIFTTILLKNCSDTEYISGFNFNTTNGNITILCGTKNSFSSSPGIVGTPTINGSGKYIKMLGNLFLSCGSGRYLRGFDTITKQAICADVNGIETKVGLNLSIIGNPGGMVFPNSKPSGESIGGKNKTLIDKIYDNCGAGKYLKGYNSSGKICGDVVNGSCGASNGITTSNYPVSGYCTTGNKIDIDTLGNDGTYNWVCNGSLGVNVNCSANRQRIYSCSGLPSNASWNIVSSYSQVGSASGWSPLTTTATYNLNSSTTSCNYVCNTNYHTEDGGSSCLYNTKTVSCSQSGKPANSSYTISNVSVTWNGTSRTAPTSCSWSCNSGYTKSGNSCIQIINGSCGSSNGMSLSTKPTSNLCNSGNPSTVNGTGPWSWTCNGSGGGTNANCSASLNCFESRTYVINNQRYPNSTSGIWGSVNVTLTEFGAMNADITNNYDYMYVNPGNCERSFGLYKGQSTSTRFNPGNTTTIYVSNFNCGDSFIKYKLTEWCGNVINAASAQ